jgi:hypothetical protein
MDYGSGMAWAWVSYDLAVQHQVEMPNHAGYKPNWHGRMIYAYAKK